MRCDSSLRDWYHYAFIDDETSKVLELASNQGSSQIEEDYRIGEDVDVMNDDLLAEVQLCMAHVFVKTQKKNEKK